MTRWQRAARRQDLLHALERADALTPRAGAFGGARIDEGRGMVAELALFGAFAAANRERLDFVVLRILDAADLGLRLAARAAGLALEHRLLAGGLQRRVVDRAVDD